LKKISTFASILVKAFMLILHLQSTRRRVERITNFQRNIVTKHWSILKRCMKSMCIGRFAMESCTSSVSSGKI